jgi:formyl transferase-like protein
LRIKEIDTSRESRPYPGAYSPLSSGGTLVIWSAMPFAFESEFQGWEPGEIVKHYYSGDLLVKTGDGFLLVTDYSRKDNDSDNLVEGTVLQSANFTEQLANIVKRHQDKYPDLIISDDILSLLPK